MNPARRRLLCWLASAPLLNKSMLSAASPTRQRWLVSPVLQDAQVFSGRVAWGFSGGGELKTSKAPLRGHAVLFDPTHPWLALVMGRRPSNHAYQFDVRSGEVVARFSAEDDRHFFGHGIYLPDGRHLLTTENDLVTGQGRIVVRDSRSFKVLQEYSSYGVGPHELLLFADGKTLAVANGGFLSGAESGGRPAASDDMKSSLVYLDVCNGARLGDYRMPVPRLSLRHLAMAPNGTLAIAMQHDDTAKTVAPIISFHSGETQLVVPKVPAQMSAQFAGYTASIACEPMSGLFAATHPKGGGVSLWRDREFAGWVPLPGAAGIVPVEDGFVVSTELGGLHRIARNGFVTPLAHFPGFKWDNHLYLSNFL